VVWSFKTYNEGSVFLSFFVLIVPPIILSIMLVWFALEKSINRQKWPILEAVLKDLLLRRVAPRYCRAGELTWVDFWL